MAEQTGAGSSGEHGANLSFALTVHFGLGFFWLFVLGAIVGGAFASIFGAGASGAIVGALWALCAAVLWVVDSGRMRRARLDPGRVWAITFGWWLKSLVAPVFVVGELQARGGPAAPTPAAPPPAQPPPPPTPGLEVEDLLRRLDRFGLRLKELERELGELRRTARSLPATPAAAFELPPTPVAAEPPRPVGPPRAEERPSIPTRAASPPAPGPHEPSSWSGLTWADLYSARVLAWLGGAVMLLGILFFFVLAVNRGWIGPVARVSLGGIASALVFAAGLYLKRRFGPVYSAYAAVGVGIAGGYVTLLAAKLRYDLVSDWSALLVAAAIAGVALALALAWPSELIAGFGLVGAMLAPAAVGLQNGELSAAGTTFAAIMFAVTALVAVRRRWQPLLGAGVAASLPQAAVLVGQTHATEWSVVAVAVAFWVLNSASALALQLRLRAPDLTAFPATLLLVGASFAGASNVVLFDGDAEGWALLGVAAGYGAAAAALFPRTRNRDLSALLAAVALVIVAFGLADLLSGPALAIAWAAEAAVLSWLARRIGELRYQLASLAYLGAALAHALALDAPPRQLYEASAHPARGGLALVGVALAAAVVASYCRAWEAARRSGGILAPLQPTLELFRASQAMWRSLTGWTGAAVALYAASLTVLAVTQWVSAASVEHAFEWGQVAVAGLWGTAALGVLYPGLRRSWDEFRAAGLAVLGASLAEALIFFATSLSGHPRAFAFLVVAAALLAGSLLDRLSRADPVAFPAIVVYVLSSLGLAVAGLVLLVGAAEGVALLALAAFYCLVAALVHRRDRDLATLLWAPTLGVACVAFAEALSGTWLVLAWAATAAVLAVIADRFAERRLQLAALAYLAIGVAHALVLDAPPRQFFEAGRHPADGVPAVLVVVLATAAIAHFLRGRAPEEDGDRLDRAIEQRQERWRHVGIVVATVLLLYAASLSILGLAEQIGTGSTASRFHGGHTAVSAVWGLLGLITLYVGLRRRLGWLQAVGFGLFAVSLAKIFLYDLTFLSSITRALSFLAVGAVLLLGGFFVQRLGTQHHGRPAA